MDPVKEIAELKAKRDALEQQLAAPGISEVKEHDINQRIIAVSNEITAYASKLPQLPRFRLSTATVANGSAHTA